MASKSGLSPYVDFSVWVKPSVVRGLVPIVWVGDISVTHDSKIYAQVGSGSNSRI